MELTADERQAFEAFFLQADTDKDGKIGVADARTFYVQFGLPAPVLGQIWVESNSQKSDSLSKDDFFVSLRLVSLAQQGQRVDGKEAAQHKGPLIPRGRQSDPWVISSQQVQVFDGAFTQADNDRDGYVTGQQARELFVQYGLPIADLKQIWEMSDADKDEKLSRQEFYVAMYLIFRKKQGDAIPSTLPSTLVPSIQQQQQQQQQPQQQQPQQHQWQLTPEESEWFAKVFREADTDQDGYVSGEEARTVFLRSKLEVTQLRKVWELVDTNKQDKLNVGEFSAAMHIIAAALKGVALPDTLPASLLPNGNSNNTPAAAAKSVTVAPINVSTSSSNIAPLSSPRVTTPPPVGAAVSPGPMRISAGSTPSGGKGPAAVAAGGSGLLGAVKEAQVQAAQATQEAAIAKRTLQEKEVEHAKQVAALREELREVRERSHDEEREKERLASEGRERELESLRAELKEAKEAAEGLRALRDEQKRTRVEQESRLEAVRAELKEARAQVAQLAAASLKEQEELRATLRSVEEAQRELQELRQQTQHHAVQLGETAHTALGLLTQPSENPFATLQPEPSTAAPVAGGAPVELAFESNFNFNN